MLKAIVDYDGYFISDEGKVFCNLGKGNRRLGKTTELYEIKPRLAKNGYTRVYCRQTSTEKRKDLYIHRLVAEYFIPNPNNKKYINHKNCIRTDNRATNLEWYTSKENNEYTLKLGRTLRDNTTGKFISGLKNNK